jgi:hypothetical protein
MLVPKSRHSWTWAASSGTKITYILMLHARPLPLGEPKSLEEASFTVDRTAEVGSRDGNKHL